MIILTSAQADKVRGISPTNSNAALDPIPLVDGTFMLPEAVLNDPAHADAAAFLSVLPKASVDPANLFNTGPKATAQEISDFQAVEATIPSFRSVGVRK